MSFDEKRESELFDLILDVVNKIDPEIIDKSNQDNQEKIKQLSAFLKMVAFPYASEKY
jgi:hypothetical protein